MGRGGLEAGIPLYLLLKMEQDTLLSPLVNKRCRMLRPGKLSVIPLHPREGWGTHTYFSRLGGDAGDTRTNLEQGEHRGRGTHDLPGTHATLSSHPWDREGG